MSTPPMTMPVIGPGRLYQGFFCAAGAGAGAGDFGGGVDAVVDVAGDVVDAGEVLGAAAAAAAGAAAAAAAAVGGGAFVNRTFNRVVPGVSTLIGGISCTGSFVTPSSATTPSIL